MPAFITFCLGVLVGIYGPPLAAWLLSRSERRARYRRLYRRPSVDDLIAEALGETQQLPRQHGRHEQAAGASDEPLTETSNQ